MNGFKLLSIIVLVLIKNISYGQDDRINEKLKPTEIYNLNVRETLTITGRVIDENTNQGVEYANVKFVNHAVGCITDENGFFKFEFDKELIKDTIFVSRIGYSIHYLPIDKEKTVYEVKLKENTIQLSEIIIYSSSSNPETILTKVINNIPDNYINTPFSMDIISFKEYYDSASDKIMNLSSFIDVYDANGYQSNKDKGHFRILETCLYEYDQSTLDWNPVKYKTKLFRDIIGIYLKDYVQYRDKTFLNSSNFKYYSFDIVEFNEEKIQIRFTCENVNKKSVPLMYAKSFQGVVEIDPANYSIMNVNSDYVFEHIEMGVNSMTVNVSYGYYGNRMYWESSFTKASFLNNAVITTKHTIKELGEREKLDNITSVNTNTCSQLK